MLGTTLSLLLVGYVPGALLYRLPWAEPEQRAALPAEERIFWHVVLSLATTSVVGFTLAVFSAYRWERLLVLDLAVCLACLAAGAWRRPPGRAAWTLTAVVPLGLAVLAAGIVFRVPPSEYVIGGRDPGVYLNEGIQIAQRGAVLLQDDLAASIDPDLERLFFRRRPGGRSDRFLAFFILDGDRGRVVGQFPHLFPVWVAVGYGLDGLSGARTTVGVLAVLGLLAVYFGGAWAAGRAAGAVGAALLSVNLALVWYSRYPNAEILVQALVFAGLLAYSRATVDGLRFFAPAAGVLLALAVFAHLSSVLVIAGVGIAALLGLIDRRRLPWGCLLPMGVALALAAVYFVTFMRGYLREPRVILSQAGPLHAAALAMGAVTLGGLAAAVRRERSRTWLHRWVPWLLCLVVLLATAYAWLLREPVGRLARHDAYALRDYAEVYVGPLALATALVGLVLLVRRGFWRGVAFLTTGLVFAGFVFYKIRIVPEHFWLSRRYLPVILPLTCLLVGVAVTRPFGRETIRWPRAGRAAAMGLAVVVLGLVTQRFVTTALPVLHHVEYAGVIPELETLAATIRPDDLVLVESRNASDLHTLAVPLAYIYDRELLVLNSRRPHAGGLARFLRWAWGRYPRVLYLGGGGSQILSPAIAARPITSQHFGVPEFERTYPAVPRRVLEKRFRFGVYELVPSLEGVTTLDLDIGAGDALHVSGFHGPETRGASETTFRWTSQVVSVFVPRFDGPATRLTLWMSAGPRPATEPTAIVSVRLGEHELGSVVVGPGMRAYSLDVPAEAAAALAATGGASEIRLRSTVWTPSEALGGADARQLGVMLERVRLE